LSAQVTSTRRELLDTCENLLDGQKNYQQAVQQVRALMFVDRFASDVQASLDRMDNADRGQ
jgi:molecular chaperone HscB